MVSLNLYPLSKFQLNLNYHLNFFISTPFEKMYFLCFYLLTFVKSEFYNTEPPNLFEIVQPKTDDRKLDQQKTEIDGDSLLILKKKNN